MYIGCKKPSAIGNLNKVSGMIKYFRRKNGEEVGVPILTQNSSNLGKNLTIKLFFK
jgi:hypothetical protein